MGLYDLKITGEFLEGLRNKIAYNRWCMSQRAFSMASFEMLVRVIFDARGCPRVMITTFPIARKFVALYAPRPCGDCPVKGKSKYCELLREVEIDGETYIAVKLYDPAPYEIVVIPHEAVPDGEVYILDTEQMDNDMTMAYCYDFKEG